MGHSFFVSAENFISEPSGYTPRLCFLGFCDISQQVKEGPQPLWHLNLIGLSSVRLFFIYPVHLQGQTAIFSIFEPALNERLLVHCRPAFGGAQDFFLPIDVSFMEIKADGPKDREQNPTATHLPGWVLLPAVIGGEVLVSEPGEYRAYLVVGENEHYIGSMNFLHAVPPPITQEEANALTSDPFARKEVQLVLSCKKCGDEIRIYAALEKNAALEAEGWCRNEDLRERFECKCGAMNVSLEWIKQGFHAALRPNLGPQLDPSISVITMYQQGVLEEQATRLKALLDSDAPSQLIRSFLETYPVFFSAFNPVLLRGRGLLSSQFTYDFAIVSASRELLLIKIESPSGALIQRNRKISPELQPSLEEAREWLRVIDSDNAGEWRPFRIEPGHVTRVKAVVIAGRTPRSEMKAKSRDSGVDGVELYTYDDLVRHLAEVVRPIAEPNSQARSSLFSSQEGCYAGAMGDCAGGLTREHYFSKAILKIFGDRELKISGLPWQQEGEEKILRAESLVANVLCNKHNGRLSPLDTEAASFFTTIYKSTRGGIQGAISTEDLRFQFDGRLIERWMLKVICGAIASGNHGGKSRMVPQSWIDVLFERRPWPQEFTFYLLNEAQYTVPDYDHARLDFVRDGPTDFVKGVTCHFMGFSMTLALGLYTGVPGVPRTKPTMIVGMKNDEREILLKLQWPHEE
jgi:hypothetical protein